MLGSAVEVTTMGREADGAQDRVVVYREALGRLVMSRRKRQDLSIGQLGERAGMSRAAVGRIEAGDSSPNIEQLRRLGDALQTTPARLLGELERAIDYLERRQTLIVEAVGDEIRARGRLVAAPELLTPPTEPLLRVAGSTLMREIEAALGLRPDPPRTPWEALLANCALAGVAPPRGPSDMARVRRELAIAILDPSFDSSELTSFGPPDPMSEESQYLEFVDADGRPIRDPRGT